MRDASDFDPISKIVYDHVEGTSREYIISLQDYDRMIDELNAREEAIRRDYREQIIALKADTKR